MRKLGISLRKLNIIMLVVAVLISVGLFVAMNMTSSIYEEDDKYTQQYIEWSNGSYDLMRASDYLTDQMQNFTVTGDRVYLDNYFTEAKETKRREHALEILSQGNSRSAAYKDLNAAMNESVSLMEREYYAARLTVMAYGYDISKYPEEIQNVKLMAPDESLSSDQLKEMAMLMVHGDEYRNRKAVISTHMENCLKDLEAEMREKQEYYSKKLKNQVVFEHVLTILIIIVLLVMVLFTYRLVIVPLRNSVNLIRDEEDLPISGAYEIRFLAKTYNLMHHTNLQNKEKLTYEATHDKLTGLYNRRGYDFLIENVDLETSALLLIDIDRFKGINDTYGHDVGDRILARVADTIFENFRAQDYVCRIGGDEIAVIMVHSDPSLSSLLVSKVKKINQTLSIKNGEDPTVSISVGVAFGEANVDPETLFKRADTCLYEVKNGTQKGISIYKADKKKSKDQTSKKE